MPTRTVGIIHIFSAEVSLELIPPNIRNSTYFFCIFRNIICSHRVANSLCLSPFPWNIFLCSFSECPNPSVNKYMLMDLRNEDANVEVPTFAKTHAINNLNWVRILAISVLLSHFVCEEKAGRVIKEVRGNDAKLPWHQLP